MSERYQTQEELREEEIVKNFLLSHPDFFSLHPEMLEGLALPHDTGKAVSLVERQVSVLRQRNVELRHRLNQLLDTAHSNDNLFEKTKTLVLHLLEADSLQRLMEVLYDQLRENFEIPSCSLLIFADSQDTAQGPARVVAEEQALSQIGGLLRNSRPQCGVLRPDETRFLFAEQADKVGSVAAVRLGGERPFGILALGNPDSRYYQSNSGTLFLSYIGEVLQRLIPRFL
ncbi:MAG: hypothetical protein VR73_02215 [Gammaproteobacteria bacterium BRH_c0]|nr:MAG: hypothetical protein VR73_02215 [Gammaproteobacteria bacterium BRH_c0]